MNAEGESKVPAFGFFNFQLLITNHYLGFPQVGENKTNIHATFCHFPRSNTIAINEHSLQYIILIVNY